MTSISTNELKKNVDAFFKKALDDKVAPDFQWAVFDKDDVLTSGAIGSKDDKGTPVTEDTLYWIASTAKFGVAILVLHVLERNLSKDGSTLQDLDNPEAVLRLLPEFSPNSKSWASKIITGFESKPDPVTGKLIPIVKARKTIPTFRQLLAHTAGLGYYWSSPHHVKWWKGDPSIDAKPLGELAFITGKVSDFDTPSLFESGEIFEYSPSLDWLGLWLIRATGKSLIQLHDEIIFNPLGISGKALVWVPPHRQEDKAAVFSPDGKGGFTKIPFDIWACEGMPPEGYVHFGSAPVWASHAAYCRVYQAALRQDERLLSKATWAEALSDQMTPYNIKGPKTLVNDYATELILPLSGDFSSGANERPTLLSALRSTTEAHSGKPPNTWSWLGLANTYFSFVDPTETANGKGVGFMFGAHLLPGAQPTMFKLRDQLEELLFKKLKVHRQ